MKILKNIYINILSELQTTDESFIDNIISRRLMVSEEEASTIRKEMINGIRKYETAGNEDIDYQSSFREKVATALTLIVASELKYLKDVKSLSSQEAGVIASFLCDVKIDKANFDKAKIKALQTGIITEDNLNQFAQNAEYLIKEMEEPSKDPISDLIETIIKLFGRYGDSLIVNYKKTINSVLDKLFEDVSQEKRLEIEKEVRIFFEAKKSDKEKQKVFVSDNHIEELFKSITAFDGRGVRIPSKEERILLGLIFYRYFEKYREEKLSPNDRIVLSALIGDILYLIWLVKNQFVELRKFKTYLKDILSYGLKDAEDKEKTLEALKQYLLPVWGALEEHHSIVEELAEKELDKVAERYAIKKFFGSWENFEKSKEIITHFVESSIKELPEDRNKWLEGKFKEYPEIWQNEKEIKETVDEIAKQEKEYGEPFQIERIETEESKDSKLDLIEQGISLSGETTQVNWTLETDKIIDKSNQALEKYSERADSFGLHGEIAEEWHAATFNIDATVKGKPYRAEVLGRNTKNSVDIVIKNTKTDKTLGKYQSKYGKDPRTTASYLEEGDYRGQKPLVPSDQVKDVTEIRRSEGRSPATDRLEHDGVESKPLKRVESENLKEKVRKRKKVFNWKDNVTYKEAFKRVGKNSAKVFGITLLTRGLFRIGKAIFSSNTTLKQELKEFIKEDIKGSFLPALKTATTGGMIVAARKGLIKFLKNISARVIATGVEVGFRSWNTAKKMWKEDISFKEGIKEIGKNVVSVAVGSAGFIGGAAIGGAILGPIGAFVGGVVGGIAGEKVSEKTINVVKTVKEKTVQAYNKTKSVVKSIFGGFKKAFKWAFA